VPGHADGQRNESLIDLRLVVVGRGSWKRHGIPRVRVDAMARANLSAAERSRL
jgi:hypothetical protein